MGRAGAFGYYSDFVVLTEGSGTGLNAFAERCCVNGCGGVELLSCLPSLVLSVLFGYARSSGGLW